jgi:hypothetical protein
LFEALAITFSCNYQFRLLLQRLRCTTRTLACTGIRTRALTAHGQALAMAQATVAAQVHQAFNIHRHFATEVAFDDELTHFFSQLFEVCVVEVFDLLREFHTRRHANVASARAADTKNRGQADFGMLVIRDVNPCDTSHCFSSNKKRKQKARRSALTLFVARIRAANHAHNALALDDLAIAANALNRCHHFHDITLFSNHFARDTLSARVRP